MSIMLSVSSNGSMPLNLDVRDFDEHHFCPFSILKRIEAPEPACSHFSMVKRASFSILKRIDTPEPVVAWRDLPDITVAFSILKRIDTPEPQLSMQELCDVVNFQYPQTDRSP